MPTTNNNWPTPVATDLVKDGWEAIKDLGDAIDTTLGVYAPSTPGLTLINTTSFSAVTSVSLPADTFSATYENYMIICTADSVSDQDASFRMRAAGSDNSTANYDLQLLEVGGSTVGGSRSLGRTSGFFGSIGATSTSPIIFDVFQPFLAKHTSVINATIYGRANLNTYVNSNIHRVASSFDSMTIIFQANTTGKVSVYGYKF
jgi:hypothetical protein